MKIEEKQERIDKLNEFRRRTMKCEKEFERSLSQLRSVMKKIRNRPDNAVNEAQALIDDIVDKLLQDDVTLHLMSGKSKYRNKGTYRYKVNTEIKQILK